MSIADCYECWSMIKWPPKFHAKICENQADHNQVKLCVLENTAHIYDETESQRDIPPISLHPPNLVMIYGDLSSVAR